MGWLGGQKFPCSADSLKVEVVERDGALGSPSKEMANTIAQRDL